jgi:hypothetical protein
MQLLAAREVTSKKKKATRRVVYVHYTGELESLPKVKATYCRGLIENILIICIRSVSISSARN